MHGVLDEILVGVVLFASVAYAVLSLGPRTLRSRLLAGASMLLRRAPAYPRVRALATRLETAASILPKGSCGGCDNCGSEEPPAGPSGSEFRIPASKIGKRGDMKVEDSPASNT
jgi:hypothetical protein